MDMGKLTLGTLLSWEEPTHLRSKNWAASYLCREWRPVSVNLNANQMRAVGLVHGGVGLYEAVRAVGSGLCFAL